MEKRLYRDGPYPVGEQRNDTLVLKDLSALARIL